MTAPVELGSVPLFTRSLSLTIGFPNDPNLSVDAQFNPANSSGLDLSLIDCEFTVEKSLKATEPNTCAIRVFNLSELSRQRLSGNHNLTVRLEAGYKTGTAQIYFGETRAAWTIREGPDYITHIESTDSIARAAGVKKVKATSKNDAKTGKITRTLGARVPIDQALNAIVDAMGIGRGNLDAALANRAGAQLTSVNGAALVGNSARRMTDLCRSAGLEWSIQDGKLQLLNIAQTLSTVKAIKISAATGMTGSPSVDSQGSVSVSTLLIPGLVPGGLVDIDSLFVSGGYRIEKIRYVGSTKGAEWHAHFDAVRY